jgi:hypothetical protein
MREDAREKYAVCKAVYNVHAVLKAGGRYSDDGAKIREKVSGLQMLMLETGMSSRHVIFEVALEVVT